MNKTKTTFILCVVVFVLFICALFIYLLDVNSVKYLTTFIITSVALVLIIICYLMVNHYEKKELKTYIFDNVKFLPMDRDYYLDLRVLIDKTPTENTSEEASKLKKMEEIAIEYEQKGNFYIVFVDENAKALVEVKKELKNKLIVFKEIYNESIDLKEYYKTISEKENLLYHI